MKTKAILISLVCLFQYQMHAQSWQWAMNDGGSMESSSFNSGHLDDNVIKIIPAIENDGSIIVISKITERHFNNTNESYFGHNLYMDELLPLGQVHNSTIVIAKHDCDGNIVFVKQLEKIPGTYNGSSYEYFGDMFALNNKYYFYGGTNTLNNLDTTLFLDTTFVGKSYGFWAILDSDFNIDTMRALPNVDHNYLPTTLSKFTVDENKNIYAIAKSSQDSMIHIAGDTTFFMKGISIAKLDTFGNVLEVHRLTDTVAWNGDFMCGIENIDINQSDLMICGWVYIQTIINGEQLTNTNGYNGFLMKLDSNYNTIWSKQPIQDNSSSFTSVSKITSIEANILNLFGTPNTQFATNISISYDGDTLNSNYNNSSVTFPVKIDPNNGNKMNWSYPDGGGGIHIFSQIITDSFLYLNYDFRDLHWQGIDINTEIDILSLTEKRKNGIFKYNLNSGAIDTVTTYSFSHVGEVGKNSTNTMVKMGDNFVVGGSFFQRSFFGDTVLQKQNSSYTDLFIAKFGTSQCVFCDSAVAQFSLNLDSFSISFSNNSLFTDNYSWQIDDSIVLQANLNTYLFTDTGLHKICIIANNSCSSDTLCQTIYISCSNVESLVSVAQNNLQVNITNNSINMDSFVINWGDNTINSLLEHNYQTAGNYQICLNAFNFCSVDTACINVAVITGINMVTSNKYLINMYPNPTKDIINIEWHNIESEHKKILVYNLFGQEVFSKKITDNNTYSLSLKDISKGIYLVVFEVDGLNVWNEKLVVEE